MYEKLGLGVFREHFCVKGICLFGITIVEGCRIGVIRHDDVTELDSLTYDLSVKGFKQVFAARCIRGIAATHQVDVLLAECLGGEIAKTQRA